MDPYGTSADRDDSASRAVHAGTDSLSGGEKSLTSLALLLSIGQELEFPWRVLDEFDVFMDE